MHKSTPESGNWSLQGYTILGYTRQMEPKGQLVTSPCCTHRNAARWWRLSMGQRWKARSSSPSASQVATECQWMVISTPEIGDQSVVFFFITAWAASYHSATLSRLKADNAARFKVFFVDVTIWWWMEERFGAMVVSAFIHSLWELEYSNFQFLDYLLGILLPWQFINGKLIL